MKTKIDKTKSSNKSSSPFFNSKNDSVFFTAQPKLKVGQPGDKYEVEADRVAEEVVSSQSDNQPFFAAPQTRLIQQKPIAESITPLVQRQEEEEEEAQPKLLETTVQKQEEEEEEELQMQPIEEEEEMLQTKTDSLGQDTQSATEQLLNSSKGNGSPLNSEIQSQMEGSFGANFSGVKIHTDSTAVQLNKELGAQAFTTGNNIYFNEGKYQPDSQNGKKLLAHELTHSVQQGAALRKTNGKENNLTLTKNSNNEIVQRKLELFKSKYSDKLTEFKKTAIYKKDKYQPSTGYGLFDVSINPNAFLNSGLMTCTVNVGWNFIDGDAAAFAGKKDEKKEWSKEEKAKWKKDVKYKVEDAWKGKYEFKQPEYYFEFFPQDIPFLQLFMNPKKFPYSMKVNIVINEVEKDWHYQLRAKKIPKGVFRGSSVTTVGGGKDLNKNYYTMDSEDLSPVSKGAPGGGKQTGAIHEFGHIFGLDDEYANGDGIIDQSGLVKSMLKVDIAEGKHDTIMGSGNEFKKQHYVTFLEALRKIVKDDKWQF